jgi:flagellar hook protein FlgE
MDVVANNIANVNTVGYKSSRLIFQDVFSQTTRSATEPTGNYGGSNPMQIGLGIKSASIDVLHNPAAMQRSDNPLDLTITGDGFFVIRLGAKDQAFPGSNEETDILRYTRAGNFYLDRDGNLVTADGSYVQGMQFDKAFAKDTDIVPVNDDTGLPEYDFAETGSSNDTTTKWGAGVKQDTINEFLENPFDATNSDHLLSKLNLAGFNGIAIDQNGIITGLNDKQEKCYIGIIAMAKFTNQQGLQKEGQSLFSETANSGLADYKVARYSGYGSLDAGGLEMSNVDLSAEFTDMIVTQRGFQANSRVITTSDTLLEELINLKR